MTDENPNMICSKCGKGYKKGFFTNCPHCNAELPTTAQPAPKEHCLTQKKPIKKQRAQRPLKKKSKPKKKKTKKPSRKKKR